MARKTSKMFDTDITKKIGIPVTTLQDWKKKSPDNWRYKLYTFLKSHTVEELEEKINSNTLADK
jgi:hypothetical protein